MLFIGTTKQSQREFRLLRQKSPRPSPGLFGRRGLVPPEAGRAMTFGFERFTRLFIVGNPPQADDPPR